MILDIFNELPQLTITGSDQPVSFDRQGNPVTARAYVAAMKTGDFSEITPVSSLSAEQLKKLTLLQLEEADDTLRLSFLGKGSFGKSELIEAVKNGTEIGMAMTESARAYCLFIEFLGKPQTNPEESFPCPGVA